jgi:hypothetical protein
MMNGAFVHLTWTKAPFIVKQGGPGVVSGGSTP